MKILICHRPGGAFGYISESWLNALNDSGHVAVRWSGNIGDWKEFDPDLYVGCSGHRQPIPAVRRAKVAIHVNPYGPIDIPGIMESNDSIAWAKSQRPDAVFGYAHESDAEMWSYWTLKAGIPFVPMATAGDTTLYKNLGNERTKSIAYVGGRWGYKAKTIDAYLFPVLKQHDYVLAGWGDWPNWLTIGAVADQDVNDLFNSAKIAPCISEYHTHTHGIDLPERVWKTTLAGCLPIHDSAKGLNRYLPSVPVADSPTMFADMVWHYLKNDDERIRLAAKLKAELFEYGHTYHHRLSRLFEVLGFDNASLLRRATPRD